MPYERIVISSGHGKYVRGASGPAPYGLDEVDEARKLVDELAATMRIGGIDVDVFHDNTSKTQNENLNTIVNHHNAQKRDLDISIHFNAFDQKAHGVEVCYLSQETLAREMSKAIASVGFTDRGAKKRTDLFFLNQTAKPAILIETCFCDAKVDCDLYRSNVNVICNEIALELGADFSGEAVPAPPFEGYTPFCVGKCSYFGGPMDLGVSDQEGLAFHYEVTQTNQHLFLPFDNGQGLARQLNPWVHYIACRWDYAVTPKTMLANSGQLALVRAIKTGRELTAIPADWGPNEDTGRVADLSPSLMTDLGIATDDEIEVIYPYKGD